MPRGKFVSTNEKHYPNLGIGYVTSMEFRRSFLRRPFRGAPSGSDVKRRLFSQARHYLKMWKFKYDVI